jgi:hypothetical protein
VVLASLPRKVPEGRVLRGRLPRRAVTAGEGRRGVLSAYWNATYEHVLGAQPARMLP